MNKQLREKLDSWDLKSVFLTILIFSAALFLFFYFTGIRDRSRADDRANFTRQTAGKILKVEKVERISQSKWNGTRFYIDSYRVTYQYKLQGQTFQNIDVIPLTTTNQKLLTDIINPETDSICLVRFDEDEPNKSILVERASPNKTNENDF